MQDKDDYNKEDRKKDGNDGIAAAAAAAAADEPLTIVVPTKTEDGGSPNEDEEQEQEQEQAHININQGQGQGPISTSSRPDAFAIYSDDNTRMLTLLGLEEEAANPNDGEQVDWRQLTGFRGLRRRINDEDGAMPSPRKTRLSFELHPDVFWNMLLEDLDQNDDGNGQPHRQQDQVEHHVEYD